MWSKDLSVAAEFLATTYPRKGDSCLALPSAGFDPKYQPWVRVDYYYEICSYFSSLSTHRQQKISKVTELNASEADTCLVYLCVSCKWERAKCWGSAGHVGEPMSAALS